MFAISFVFAADITSGITKVHVYCWYQGGGTAWTNEIDTLEYQQTEKIETEPKDVDRIRIRKVYTCCPGWHSGGS